MPQPRQIPQMPDCPLRVILIDANPVFRGACRALLITEGVDVVADLAPGPGTIGVVQRMRPHVVLLDARESVVGGDDIASLTRSLAHPPAVLLMSRDGAPGPTTAIGAEGHLAKADICAEAIVSALRLPMSSSPGATHAGPSHRGTVLRAPSRPTHH